MAKGFAIGASKLVGARATDANNFKRSIPVWTKCSFTQDSVADSGLGTLLAQAQLGQLPLYQRMIGKHDDGVCLEIKAKFSSRHDQC
ncbi:hypothetical protein ACFXTI_028096 [Malus domestica]